MISLEVMYTGCFLFCCQKKKNLWVSVCAVQYDINEAPFKTSTGSKIFSLIKYNSKSFLETEFLFSCDTVLLEGLDGGVG